MAPVLITFAQKLPQGIGCSLCDAPEVVEALIRANDAGRGQVISLISSYGWLLVGLGCFNIFSVTAALFVPALTKRSSGEN